ncbi:MAG TPA: hypothetical protein VGR28_08330 [Candidatus Thermoplasmatota archaeon]|jgi:hypothetical protein|nr:hypothetical protein [Candidatus Thermoplasmatota archaeon]
MAAPPTTSRDRDDEPHPGLYARDPREHRTTTVVKVRLPVEHHLRLHSLRVMRGEGISETVTAALAMYFEQMRNAELAARALPQPQGT